MEHIVQFAVSVDDEYISRRLEKQGYDDVIEALKNKAYSEINHNLIYDETIMKQFLEDNKETIIERAVSNITASIKSSKKYREALAEVAQKVIG